MDTMLILQSFSVNYRFDIHFTKDLFAVENLVLKNTIQKQATGAAKVIVVMDENIAKLQPALCEKIAVYAKNHSNVIRLCEAPILMPGGEVIKNDLKLIDKIYESINKYGICRHSYIIAIGGGALLDMVGFAAATAHRGIRLIRVPTTVLAQNDSGVGVKNAINYFGKKNYIGTFAPPYAVLNDFNFLVHLPYRDWLSGLAEACKVALIKDADFFSYISSNAKKLSHDKDMSVMEKIIYRSAELHTLHIGKGGDPFELGSSRPLDFGHWAAHKLEQITAHRLRHGEAVAIGVALDSTYSYLTGLLSEKDWQKILDTLYNLGFVLFIPELEQGKDDPCDSNSIFRGLIEFREHLGGELTIMMLEKIGKGVEIHEVDYRLFKQAIDILKEKFEYKENFSNAA